MAAAGAGPHTCTCRRCKCRRPRWHGAGGAGHQPGRAQGRAGLSDFAASISNAYANEITWTAWLRPFRKRTSLTVDEAERLYEGMRACLLEPTEKVRAELVFPKGAMSTSSC